MAIALITLRIGTATEIAASTYVLKDGEPGWDKTNRILKIGNNVDLWADLPSITGGGGGEGGPVNWADVLNKPTTFPPSAHSHAWTAITDKPTVFPPVDHTHSISQVTDLATELGALLDLVNSKPDNWTELADKPTVFPPSAHTHLWADTTDKPTDFPPSAHSHPISGVTGLQAELNQVPLSAWITPVDRGMYADEPVTAYWSTLVPTYAAMETITFSDAKISGIHNKASVITAAGNGWGINQNISGPGAGVASPWHAEFILNGTDMAIRAKPVSGFSFDYRVFINDQPIHDWQQMSSQTEVYLYLQLPTFKARKIRIEFGAKTYILSYYLPGSNDLYPTPRSAKQVAVIGDSYIAAGQVTGPQDGVVSASGFCGQLGLLTGWDVWVMGQAGTGYSTPAGATTGATQYGSAERMTYLANLPVLDLIIVFGGGNDYIFSIPTATVTADAAALYAAIATARPGTPVLVVGVEPRGANTDPEIQTMDAAIQAAADAAPNVIGFISMSRPSRWWAGTGHAITPNGTGSADIFVSDGTHLTRAGYTYITERIVSELKRIKV